MNDHLSLGIVLFFLETFFPYTQKSKSSWEFSPSLPLPQDSQMQGYGCLAPLNWAIMKCKVLQSSSAGSGRTHTLLGFEIALIWLSVFCLYCFPCYFADLCRVPRNPIYNFLILWWCKNNMHSTQTLLRIFIFSQSGKV